MRIHSLASQAVSGAAWTLTGSGGLTALKLAVLAILARLLSPQEFGVFGAALMAVMAMGILAKFGISQAIVQLPTLTREHLVAGLHLSVALGTLAGAILAVGAGAAERLLGIEGARMPMLLMSAVLPLTGFFQVSEAMLQRNLRFRFLSLEQMASYGIGYAAVAIVLAYRGFGAWALAAGTVTQTAMSALVLGWASPPVLGVKTTRQAYRDLLDYSGGHALAELGRSGAYQVDNFIVGSWLGAEALGLYGRAFQSLTMPTKLLGVGLLKVLFPLMSRIQSDSDRLRNSWIGSMGIVALLGFPFGLGMIVLVPEIVQLLLGSQWTGVVVPFQILSTCVVFRIGQKVCEALIRACGYVYRLAWLQWLYMGLVATGAYLGQFRGLNGVAVGVALAVGTSFLLIAALAASLCHAPLRRMAHMFFRHLALAILVCLLPALWAVWSRAAGLPATLRLATSLAGMGLAYAALLFRDSPLLGPEGHLFRKLLMDQWRKKSSPQAGQSHA